MVDSQYDIAVVGAGIVGLATTFALTEIYPQARIVVLEKEAKVAAHQTGHNSGVIHSGIYYKPGSLKARLSVEGARRMMEFCEANEIPVERCGKVIVATEPSEIPRLETLHERAIANGVVVERIGPERLRELEPNAAGLDALHSPNTAIVDYKQVAQRMRDIVEQRGVEFQMKTQVIRFRGGRQDLRVLTNRGEVATRFLVNCAGLYSDVIARKMGLASDVRIVPFRGEYYFLKRNRSNIINGLIYPVPDPGFPFLGVHFTRTVDGRIEAGPNAVLAFAREGYTKRHVNISELSTTLRYTGFWKLARKHWRMGLFEFYRSFSKGAFLRSLQRLVPSIEEDDIVPGGAGVRAQALKTNGDMVDDFSFVRGPRSLHVLNAPSPAATASFEIGRYIAKEAATAFGTTK